MPEDFGAAGYHLEGETEKLIGEAPGAFFTGAPDSEVIHLCQVHFMEEQLLMLSTGFDEQVLDGLPARFVLDPGHDGERVEQASPLHVGGPFVVPAAGP